MEETASVADLRAWVGARRQEGRTIGLVPTMGYLHEGHLLLVDEARRRADAVVMSIFVNPIQFSPTEDLERYPRDLPRDRTLARERGVDLLFTPDANAMYAGNGGTRVVPGVAGTRWEAASRPTHFAGVLTVVAKLFNLVRPDIACFGQKDAQQFALVRAMARDLDFPLEVVRVRTAREPDGVALSSRNAYLSESERVQARALSAALGEAHARFVGGERSAAGIARAMRAVLEGYPGADVEYVAVVDPESLAPVETVDASTLVALAARVGSTRLIDNVVLGEGLR